MAGGQRKSRRGRTTVLGGLLGAAAFLVFLMFLQAGLFLSLLAAAGGFAAGLLLANDPRSLKISAGGPAAKNLDAALAAAEGKLEEFESLIGAIESESVRRKARQIAELERKILEDIEADPKDFGPARGFLSYYQDASVNILRKYQQILDRGASSSEVRAAVSRVDPILETIRSAFEKQLARLLENDVLDLDTEITVLEETLKMEGWDLK
jgi:5-bromo-4-chloroindolyl phosphate hydrolysis protein